MKGLLASLLLPAFLAIAAPTPDPAGATIAASWLATEAPAVIATAEGSSLTPEQLLEVTPGTAQPVANWTAEFTAGEVAGEPIEYTDEWIAPLELEGSAVGALALVVRDGAVQTYTSLWDPELGAALLTYSDSTFINESGSRIWFRLSASSLSPVTADARALLAGSIALADYQPFLTARLVPNEAAPPVTAPASSALTPVLLTAGIMVLLLGIAGITAWIRHPESSQ